MQHSREGLLAVHTAVLIFGVTALFSKLIDLPALEITFYRSLFAAGAIAIYIAYKRKSFQLNRSQDYLMAVVLGIFLAVHWVSYFYAMKISSVAVGVIALYTYPVITVFLEPFFHGEKPHIADVLSSFAVLFGIYLIVPDFSLDNNTMLGVLAGVFSAVMISLRNIVQRRYFSEYPASHALLYQATVVFIVLFFFIEIPVADIEINEWWLLVLLGVMFTALPHTLFAHSLRYLKAKTASLIACVQVVYSAVFASVFLGEVLLMNVIIGGLIIISASMFESLPKKRVNAPGKTG